MRFTPTTDRCSNANRTGALQQVLAAVLLAVVGGVACTPAEAPVSPLEVGMTAPASDAAREDAASQTLIVTNGIITNGIITNGIITNGIITNGIITNGIITNGLGALALGSEDFATWFNSEEPTHATLMSYLVRCVVPAGETRTFTNPSNGHTYRWEGGLGLAPDWASGQPATEVEQQVVTACLLAHVNKFGVHVDVSMLGTDAEGTPIPVTAEELATFSEPEGCFFGNGFAGTARFFVGSDHAPLNASQSSVRACALDWANGGADCEPLLHVGACSQYCTKDPSGHFYTSCTYNGVTYKPLTTRVAPADIYTCGDGVCQVSESCGTGNTFDSCYADCGACP